MISFKSSFENTDVVFCSAKTAGQPDQNIFLWIAGSVADAAAVNLCNIKTLLANSLNAFPIKGKSVFSNGPGCLPKNPPMIALLHITEFLITLY